MATQPKHIFGGSFVAITCHIRDQKIISAVYTDDACERLLLFIILRKLLDGIRDQKVPNGCIKL